MPSTEELQEGNIPLVVIGGPTACGKTELVLKIAPLFRGEIVSADSRKVYRSMKIGTAKPTKEVCKRVKFHLVDIVELDTIFTAADFKLRADEVISQIHKDGGLPFLVGGSGLYIRAVVDGLFPGPPPSERIREELSLAAAEFGGEYLYQRLLEVDPLSASRIERYNIRRLIRALEVYYQTGRPISDLQRFETTHQDYDLIMVAVMRDRMDLYQRIDLRVEKMIECGLVEEVKGLLERGYSQKLPSMEAIGYRQLIGYLKGEYDLEEAIRLIKRDSRRFAKRQLTWFRKDSRYKWFHPEEEDEIVEYIRSQLRYL